MAQEEARLRSLGVKFVNQGLLQYMPQRTLEAIKGHRRRPDYRSLVALYTVSTPWGHDASQAEETADHVSPTSNTAGSTPAVGSPPQVTRVTRDPTPSPPPPPPPEVDTPTISRQTPNVTITDFEPLGDLGDEANDMNDYQWRGPLKAAIIRQADNALIDPELLLYATQSPHGADGRVQEIIDRDLLGLLPPVVGRGHRDKHKCQEARNAHARRRAEYARIQSLYRRSRTACARTVLAGHWRGTPPVLPLAQQTAYWKPLFETLSTKESREPSGARPMWDIIRPFSNEEVARTLRAMKDGAPGPDQNTKERLLLLPVTQLTCRFNIWLLLGVAPDSFRNGVTVLIPKSGDAVEPAQFTPITIGPILCRLFHRILAQRIEASYSISERQKAFRKGDGIADNTYILRYVLADRKARCQPISVAFLDVAKAFDSVSHESLFLASSNAGIPEPLVVYIRSLYIRSLYAGSRTRLKVSDGLSDEIMIKRGVRQGDPLSPVLFNAIIDMCIQHRLKHRGPRRRPDALVPGLRGRPGTPR